MSFETLTLLALALAAIPCLLFLVNLGSYRAPRRAPAAAVPPAVSVLIPARNEAANIEAALASVLANRGVELEAIVLDDGSTDGTADLVRAVAARDGRVRLESAPPLPAGWCGKPHACHVLAGRARHPWLVFMDADVRLASDALERMTGFMRPGLSLASGVPRQVLGTFSERLLIPLIHFVLLGFLPVFWMRRSRWRAFAAGCGQLFIVRGEDYRRAGGHAAIRTSLHDGLKLPRAFRMAGMRTDLFDATEVASCRMYSRDGEVWSGLAKNATEGLAAPGRIGPMSVWLLGGGVLPFGLLALAPFLAPAALPLAAWTVVVAWLPRFVAAWRFRQSWLGALLHPLGLLGLVGIQWYARVRAWRGRPSTWRGRAYPAVAPAVVAALGLGLACAAGGRGAAPSTNAAPARIPSFTLDDQHGRTHEYRFPKTNLSLVAVADRKGSAQIEGWVRPVKARYGVKLDIDGVADVSAVPGPLRGVVTRRFKQELAYPVMLDWTGAVCERFAYVRGQVGVVLLDRQGRVLARWEGAATDAALRALYEAVDRAGP